MNCVVLILYQKEQTHKVFTGSVHTLRVCSFCKNLEGFHIQVLKYSIMEIRLVEYR